MTNRAEDRFKPCRWLGLLWRRRKIELNSRITTQCVIRLRKTVGLIGRGLTSAANNAPPSPTLMDSDKSNWRKQRKVLDTLKSFAQHKICREGGIHGNCCICVRRPARVDWPRV